MSEALPMSVVLGTLNRLPFLKRALASVETAVEGLAWELIVIDGGSEDGTWEWLSEVGASFRQHPPVRVEVRRQETRTGAVAAYNLAFSLARATYVAAFNDDAEYVGVPLASAFLRLRRSTDVGQVAIPFLTQKVATAEEIHPPAQPVNPKVAEVNLPARGRVPYANFSVTRRAVGERLGWWGDFYHYAGDTHLSAGVWFLGLKVLPLDPRGGYIIHYEAQDDTRLPNVETPHFNELWRNPRRKAQPPARAAKTEEFVRLVYVGRRSGNCQYQRPGSSFAFIVSTQRREIMSPHEDVKWLLELREGGKPVFQKGGEA